MAWRKVIAVLFGLMMLAATVSLTGVRAGEAAVTVILVSDNEADCALAEYLANLTGAVVVTTTWGTYDPNVTAEVMGYGPDRVIIIGGPEAVVEEYVSDLQDLNITVERWWGKNRYETNLAVFENASRLGLRFENSVVMVPGNDTGAIREALREALRTRGIIVFANNTTDPVRIMVRLGVGNANVTIIRSRVTERIAERIMLKLESRTKVRQVEVNVTPDMALEAINVSEARISTAEGLLANVTLPEEKKILAERMLNLSKAELERAKEAYEAGNYWRAYGQAIAAKAHAEVVIRIASKEWEVKLRFDPAMRAETFIYRVERQLAVMERAGIDVTGLKALLEQLKAAVENGDYDVVNSLMTQIRRELMEAYTHGKGKFWEQIRFPDHGRWAAP
ncbi:cell wall-binding repeat-containing protein [Thermococcus sp. MV11]|uniref:cell wall-binding repeat-containing protein n=1 Tax=Thermococcus sp. MV11 TaxID=1638267 RepID=UPI001430E746|nr:hypothetical protein [Thermococcus sp. MV11]NJE02955.1 hypothetical protein [Thermococcus sp. MV11]